jgi:stage V sporulation protein D (sporulation-specific penicillin-binding protein)
LINRNYSKVPQRKRTRSHGPIVDRNRPVDYRIKRNLFILFAMISIIFLGLIIRLFYLMGIDGKYYKTIAVSQWVNKITIQPKRGRILDRNGRELVVSADVYRVDLDMNVVKTTLKSKEIEMEELASQLASILKMELGTVNKILDTKTANGLPASFVTLKRRVEKSEADEVLNLKLRGIMVSSDIRRYYANNNFLSHVLGGVDQDGNGLTGIELSYNKLLSGIAGMKIVETDLRKNPLPYIDAQITDAVPGKDLVLTIDEKIQHMAEDVAQRALEKNKAHSVSITVMDPRNGEILAMVNKPDFDSNFPRKGGTTLEQLQEMWKNRAVENVFEPGSIFKVLTTAAALEKGVVTEDYKFVCTGSHKVGGVRINCWKRDGHGTQNLVDILRNSCNVGYMELGRLIGKEGLMEFVARMGIGSPTGVDLPGESKGIVKDVKNISDIDLATISFGQSIAVTQLQFLNAFNVVANGGYIVKPHIVKEISSEQANKSGSSVNNQKLEKKMVLDANIASTIRKYLERTVSDGGSRQAFIDGYSIGGKTGTAQRVNFEDGTYGRQQYVSSFVGLAPSDNPVVSLIITIDQPDPSNYYAGQTAAPAAKELFRELLDYIAFKSSNNRQ